MRTILIYFIVVIALRIMGKRQVAELAPAELVVTIMISNIATLSIEDTNIPILGSVLPIFVLVGCEVTESFCSLKSRIMRKLFSGSPRIIIRDGEIDQKELGNLRWSIDDLTEQMRQSGIFDIREVSFAMVETSGSLSAYQKFGARPASAQMLSIPANGEPDSPPLTVIADGQLDADALGFLNLRREWLDKVLTEKQLTVEDVFMMTCDRRAEYRIIEKEKAKKRA